MKKIAIILGGGLNLETQELNVVSKMRYDIFLEIEDQFDYVICSAGKTYREEIAHKVKDSEARVDYNYLISKGINKTKILIEENSRDTFSNAYFSRLLIENMNLGHNITIITSNFHMKKSEYVFNFVFDSTYTLNHIGVDDSILNQEELRKRKISEEEVINFYKTHLDKIYQIKKGNMNSIKIFIDKYNRATSGITDSYHKELTKRVEEKIGKCSPIY